MKRIKRIIAVVILCLVVLLVGYSCYTGSRLTGYPQELEGYQNITFRSKDGTMVVFAEEYAWYASGEQEIVLLTVEEYKQGVIIMKRNDITYHFTAIDTDTLYDEQTQEFLTRRGADG